VECVVAQEDNVYPMIPAGQTVNEIIDTPVPTGASDQVTVHGKKDPSPRTERVPS
jgi:hypothetical protein